MTEIGNPAVSVVIPNKDDWDFVFNLLTSLTEQTFKDFELIVIDSSNSLNQTTKNKIKNLQIENLFIHTEGQAFPGRARNIGVSLAKGKYIAFMDAKTIPEKDWIELIYHQLITTNADIVLGKFKSANKNLNYLQKIIKSNTYGNLAFNSVSGSLLTKAQFQRSGGFDDEVGAGEDLEWVERLKKLKWKIDFSDNLSFYYLGFPKKIPSFIYKWIFYSFENAKINILSYQKTTYSVLVIILFLYFTYSWNYLFTGGLWDDSPYFIPNLNKIIWTIIFSGYFLYRGFYLPLQKKENFLFIFPFNWIFIGIAGLSIDLLKIPGRLYGLWRLAFLKSDLN